uniref:RHG42 n=1 Tax=Schistocephalus solidus TaxID=70667 RepID=A0A183SB19_SCHSO
LADPKLAAATENGLTRGRKSDSGNDLAGRPRAPIAETEGNLPNDDNSRKSKTGTWMLARHHLPRLGSVDARRGSHSYGVSTPTLDKSVSECNLPSRIGARNLSTSSTTSLKNLFSPFRVPNGPLPLIRQSTTTPGNCLPSSTYNRAEVLSCSGHHEDSPDDSASSHSIGSWNSLMTLEEEAEEDEDCASARRRRGGHHSKTPVETCSLILPPSMSDHKKRSFGSRAHGSKSSKKRGVLLLGSGIFYKSAGGEGQQTDLASRRESFFKRGFLRK